MESPLRVLFNLSFLRISKKWSLRKYIYYIKKSTYFRYTNDTLLIYPRKTTLPNLVNVLNSIGHTMDFTDETKNVLPFLNIILNHTNFDLKLNS